MAKVNPPLLAFNRGLVSPFTLAREDIDRTRLSCSQMDNWIPKTQGAMLLRPGLGKVGSTDGNEDATWIEFVAATDDTALLEITDTKLRVWVDDSLVTRASVSTTISNGSFATSTNWTDASSHGGVIAFGGSGLVLDATTTGGIAKCTRQITVAGGDQNVEHALTVNVTRGPVTFAVGSSSGEDDYVTETTLRTGYHSLAFTPTGDFYLTFKSLDQVDRIVASIAVESSGTMEVTAPWAAADLSKIRFEQSADVVYVACEGYAPYQIERRGTGTSWSVVKYRYDKGPFLSARSAPILMTPGARYGNTTLTASEAFFTTDHVGAIFRVFHSGQSANYQLAKDNVWTEAWEVTGIDDSADSRKTTIVTTGTWSGTLSVQKSYDGPDRGWFTLSALNITTNTTTTYTNGDDNVSVWYRVGFGGTGHTSGTVNIAITYAGGGKTGVCRVTARNSATEAAVEVLEPFSDITASDNWQEGWWSNYQIWPTAVALFEGRLWWFGGTQVFGSVSDDYENFDDDTEGDSGPIVRTIGRGPVDKVVFALPLLRLIFGTAGAEIAMRSSSFDQPLTPSNNSSKAVSTQGSAAVRAVAVDMRGIFVQRSGRRVYMLAFDLNSGDYVSQDLTLLVPELLSPGVQAVGIQRQPDTRIHFVLEDGTVAILTYEPSEDVMCWSKVETDGEVERVAVLPGADEDLVYYQVKRVINSATVRFLEKWALESETSFGTTIWTAANATTAVTGLPYANSTVVTVRDANGAKVENLTVTNGAVTLSTAATYAHITPSLCKLADSFVTYSGSAVSTLTGLSHLEGEEVVVWADGRDYSYDESGVQKTYTVSSGQIEIADAVQQAVIGLPYEAKWRTTKLAYGAALGTALTQQKRVDHVGFILRHTHNNGLYFGRDFDNMDPAISRGVVYEGYALDADDGGDQTVFMDFDKPSFPFDGRFDTDARICLKALAPRPCGVMAAVPSMATHDKA